MKTVDYIKMNLEASQSMVSGMIDDMKDAPLVQPTPNGGNHPLWILGHLTYSEANIVDHIMQGNDNPLAEWNDVFGGGSEPVTDLAHYPAWDEVRAKFDEVRANTMKVLSTLSDDDLDQPSKNCSPEREAFFGTVGQCFMVIGLHAMMHFGQLADARRMDGRKPMMG